MRYDIVYILNVFDGDLCMLTDNDVLVRKLKPLPALMCVQRKAEKKIPTEADIIQSNIASFGNDIGKITNYITSMFEVQSHFDKNSEEYKTLDYRIKCGQLYQQASIDKAKGILAKPMPREWYDRHAVNLIEDENKRKFYRDIVADRKPYFMRYIYPDLKKQYKAYVSNANRNALREFQMTVDEMLRLPYEDLTERQRDFLYYYDARLPVGTGDCVMNKICRRFEEEFDSYLSKRMDKDNFDSSVLKSDVEYTRYHYYEILRLYEEYIKRLKGYRTFIEHDNPDPEEVRSVTSGMETEFRRRCSEICPDDEELCNICVDMCYKRSSTKRFVWDICGHTIIHNLLLKNDNKISYPALDESGTIHYCGNTFSIQTKQLELEVDN